MSIPNCHSERSGETGAGGAREAFRGQGTGSVAALRITRGIGLSLVVSLAAALMAAEPTSSVPVANPDRIIELPKFEVTDSRMLPPPEKWNYAEIPGFEILSNVSQRGTKRFVEDFLLLQEAVKVLMPGLRLSSVGVPTSLILTGKGDSFNQFVPEGENRYGKNSVFFNEPERSVIVVDFALSEIQLEDNTTIEADAYRSFYKEYFRQLIRHNTTTPPPAWFEEGLVQLFSAIDFNKKWITFAMIGDGFGGEKTGDFNTLLAKRALIPFAKFFEDPPTERGTFYNAQAYAFVHMCLYGRNMIYQRPLVDFIRRLDKEPVSEQLFKECFRIPNGKDKDGKPRFKVMDYKSMALELRGYIGFTDYKAMQSKKVKGQLLPDPPAFELKAAPDAVVGRLKGEALRLAGSGADAHNNLIAPYVRGERDPRLLAAIGLDEVRAGNEERALKFLTAASDAKVDRVRAYLELAKLRLKTAKEKPGAGKDKLNDAQVISVLTPLFTARKLPPPMAEVYALIAETWALSAQAPQRDHFEVVLEGVRMFPRNTDLLLQATLLAMRRGFPDDGRALAKLGERVAPDASAREQFRMLETMMDRDANPNAAADGAAKPPQKAEAFLIKPEP